MGVGFVGIDIQTDIIVESIICKNMNMRSREKINKWRNLKYRSTMSRYDIKYIPIQDIYSFSNSI